MKHSIFGFKFFSRALGKNLIQPNLQQQNFSMFYHKQLVILMDFYRYDKSIWTCGCWLWSCGRSKNWKRFKIQSQPTDVWKGSNLLMLNIPGNILQFAQYTVYINKTKLSIRILIALNNLRLCSPSNYNTQKYLKWDITLSSLLNEQKKRKLNTRRALADSVS